MMGGLKQEWKRLTKIGEEVTIHFYGVPYKGVVVERNLETVLTNAAVTLQDGEELFVIPAYSPHAVLVADVPKIKKEDSDLDEKEKKDDEDGN